MTLKPCRECAQQVSAQARTCPHCGIARPGPMAISDVLMGLVAAVFIGIIALLILASVL